MADINKKKKETKKKEDSAAAAAIENKPVIKTETGSQPLTETTKEPSKEGEKVVKAKKKKLKQAVPTGKVYIQSTFNNTLITVTDPAGQVLTWGSAGAKGFKGARKGTPFAAQVAAEDVSRKAMDHYGLKQVSVFIKGTGAGRESALRALQNVGLKVSFIKDVTPIPHNGCRPPKKRRV